MGQRDAMGEVRSEIRNRTATCLIITDFEDGGRGSCAKEWGGF